MSEHTGSFVPPSGAQRAVPAPRPPLRRSWTDRKVAGVCGGLAAHLGIDPLILRVMIVVLSLFGGTGLILYAAGWLLIPDEGEDQSEIEHLVGGRGHRSPVLAAIIGTIIAIVVLVAFAALFHGGWFFGPGPDVWPLLVVAAVAFVVWYRRRQVVPGSVGTDSLVAPHGSPQAAATASATSTTAWAAAPTAEYPSSATAPGWYPSAGSPADPSAVAEPGAEPAKRVRTRRERSVLGPLTWSLVLVAAGVMVLLDQAGVWNVRTVPFLAVLLAILGLGLVAGAWFGRSRGLIVGAAAVSLITVLAAAAPGIDSRHTGAVTWAPTTVSAVPAGGYQWAAGKTQLDLSQLALTGQTIDIRAQLGAGQLRVLVPSDVRVVVHAHVGVGSITILGGQTAGGVGRTYTSTVDATGTTAQGTIDLDLKVGAGNVEVDYAQA